MENWQIVVTWLAGYVAIAYSLHLYLIRRAQKNKDNPYAFWRLSK